MKSGRNATPTVRKTDKKETNNWLIEKSWAKPFAEKIFPLINEENFSVLYSDKASAQILL